MVQDMAAAFSLIFDPSKFGVKSTLLDHEDDIDFQKFLKDHTEAMQNG